MFSEGLIILFACVSLVAFAVSKNKTGELNKEDTAQYEIEESRK